MVGTVNKKRTETLGRMTSDSLMTLNSSEMKQCWQLSKCDGFKGEREGKRITASKKDTASRKR